MCCLAVLQALGSGNFNLFFLLTCSFFFPPSSFYLNKEFPISIPFLNLACSLTAQGYIMPQVTCQGSHTEDQALFDPAGCTCK